MKVRECKDCKVEGRQGKPLEAPYPGPRCYLHHKAYRRVRAKKTADYKRASRFGISGAVYESLLELQGGGCAWCGRKPYKGGKRLATDHDHRCCPGRESCGKCVRGLLCDTCNWALRHFRDDPQLVERGAEYLRNPPAYVVLNARTG